MDDLKQCPFCGGKAYLFVNDGVRVCCGKCGASTKILVDGWYGNLPSGNATLTVIKNWNQRMDDN